MLKEFEIFKAGKYGESESRVWTDEEVNQIVSNYDYNFRRSPIKLGHDGFFDNEKPAVGWVKELKLNDNKVLVAVGEFNENDVDNIKDRYINVSIEVTKSIQSYDLETDKTGAYLLGVALLGSSQPAVAGLKPIEFKLKDENTNFISTNINFENESFKILNTNDILSEKQGEEDMEKLEKFRQENEKLQAELEKYKQDNKKNVVISFFEAEKTKIVPAVKDEMVEFAMDLNDTQLDKFKKIISAMPELQLFNNDLDNTREPKTETKQDLTKQALEDFEAYRNSQGGIR